MRYKDFKIVEAGNATLLVDNLRKNLEVAANSGVASKLEGIDAVVRLGYLGKHSPESIAKSFGIMDPWDPLADRAVGSYNAAKDELATVYRRLMDPSARLDTATTVAHELRHRAFRTIRQFPELNSRMPGDLRTKWKDGYGDVNIMKKYYWAPPGQVDKIQSTPEHAMIYSIQDPNLETGWRKVYLQNPMLGNRSAEYWADLYSQVNAMVAEFIEQELNKPTTGELPNGALATPEDENKNFRLEPWVKEYYEAWDSIANTKLSYDIQLLGLATVSYKLLVLGSKDFHKSPLLAIGKQAPELLEKGYFAGVKDIVDEMISKRNLWKPGRRGTQAEWNKTVQNLQERVNTLNKTLGEDWRPYDVRYYDGTFVKTFAPLVKKPKVPVVPTIPVQPPDNPKNPANPPLPVPKTGKMSMMQFAQQTKNSAGSTTMWQAIITAPNSNSVKNQITFLGFHATLARLQIVPATQEYITTLIAAWDSIPNDGKSRESVAEVFLGQVLLEKS